MQEFSAHIRGQTPLLIHSDRGVDALDPLRIEISNLTSKRLKTEDDHKAISWLEWCLNAYLDEAENFVMPTRNIHACLRDSAKRVKKGKIVDQAIVFENEAEKIIFEFDGEKNDLKALFDSGQFMDRRSVGNQKNRVMRTRPRFNEWELHFKLAFDETSLSRRELLDILQSAGRYIGLGDYRPTFGRFEIVSAD